MPSKCTVSATLERMISKRKVDRVDYRGIKSLRLTAQRKEDISKMTETDKEEKKDSPEFRTTEKWP